jgi:tetratricopeptide (TPR) repeat protein
MKKRKCTMCVKKKARRKCIIQQDKLICSSCCAELRNPDCEDCQYFRAAMQYRNSKAQKVPKKQFIIEVNEEVENAVDNALAFVERGDISKGQEILKKLQKQYPKNHVVNYGIGVVNAFKGQYDDAIKYFTRATDIFPYFIEAHFNKAVAYKNKLDIKNMISSFKEVISIGDPHDDMVQKANSFVVELEQQVMATDNITLEQYFQAQEKFEIAFSNMEKKEWEKAIGGFEECLMINKRHPQSYGNMGICYAQTGRKSEALAALDKALEIDPQYEPAIVNRSLIESLDKGKKLEQEGFMSIDYYKDYPLKKKSFIESIYSKLLGR